MDLSTHLKARPTRPPGVTTVCRMLADVARMMNPPTTAPSTLTISTYPPPSYPLPRPSAPVELSPRHRGPPFFHRLTSALVRPCPRRTLLGRDDVEVVEFWGARQEGNRDGEQITE